MTVISLVKNLRALGEIDNSIAKVQAELNRSNVIIDQDRKAIAQLQQRLVGADHEQTAARKLLHTHELDAQALETQESQKRAQLDTIHNQKELNALQKEIDALARERNNQEDTLLKSWHAVEAAEKKFIQDKKDIEEKIEALKQEIAAKETAQLTITTQLQELADQREAESKNLTAEWLATYERMKKSVKDPIVPLVNSSCSACYYAVPPQDYTLLKKAEILPCRNCYRLLYIGKAE